MSDANALKAFIYNLIYNLYFHAFGQVPGPKAWAATRLTFISSLLRGNLVHDVSGIHKKYGPIVRLAPNEISFAKEEAWDEIFGLCPGRSPFPKNPIYYSLPPGQPHNIVTTSNVDDHARMRRVLSHAFTPAALKAQEPIIESFVDLLISRLKEELTFSESASNEVVLNMVDWYNYTAFDIIGDLAFGESFDCLRDGVLHPWVALIFNFLKGMTLAASARYYPWLSFLLTRFLVPKRILKMADNHFKLAESKIHHCVNLEKQRADFMTPVLNRAILPQGQEGKGMTLPEIESTLFMLMIAGSETVSTALITGVECAGSLASWGNVNDI